MENVSILRFPKVHWEFRYQRNQKVQQCEKGMDANMSALNTINGEEETAKLLSLCLSYCVTSALNNLEQQLTNHFLK